MEAHLFAHEFPGGVCDYNGWLPADQPRSNNSPASCALSRDQISIGESILLRFDRLLVLREDAADAELRARDNLAKPGFDVFGYVIAFTKSEDASGAFGNHGRGMRSPALWLITFAGRFPVTMMETKPLWTGYARRFFQRTRSMGRLRRRFRGASRERLSWKSGRGGISQEEGLKTLDMICSCEVDRLKEARDEVWVGVSALGVLKGDVDNLGEMFRVGLGNPTFAKTAALSRQMNASFGIFLPWLLSGEGIPQHLHSLRWR